VNVFTATSLAVGVSSAVPSPEAYLSSAAPTQLACAASVLRASTPTVAGTGLAQHSHKRFAMAGIDINVWPLGPQERSSG
jgi:hypothetical protein